MIGVFGQPVHAIGSARLGDLKNPAPDGLQGALDAVLEQSLPVHTELQDARPHYSYTYPRFSVTVFTTKKLVNAVEQARSTLARTQGKVNSEPLDGSHCFPDVTNHVILSLFHQFLFAFSD